MNVPKSSNALVDTLANARDLLLNARDSRGAFCGELSSSALSTATASMALAMTSDPQVQDLARAGHAWLCEHQNVDGGWGDTVESPSNISTTLLAWSSLGFADHDDAGARASLERAAAWLEETTGELSPQHLAQTIVARYGEDRTFSVPILTVCALAGRLGDQGWQFVPSLPFELAACPHGLLRLLELRTVSYALPALIAIGQVRHFHHPTRNPITWVLRQLTRARTLRKLATIQPTSGGFLEAAPLTSFVVMSLASSQLADHPVTRRGLDFVLRSARDDGSWPIDTNLATWVTTLSVNALADGDEQVDQLGCLDWILQCQTRKPHSYTGAAPGGWGWSDLTGSVPDADDTAGALLAISAIGRQRALCKDGHIEEPICSAAAAGIDWLLDLQNRDGGWPTFCRGWGKLPFDRSGTDLTAHAIRALCAWTVNFKRDETQNRVDSRAISAIERAFDYLREQQREDGSWMPLWFGNEHTTGEENPIYGTAKVLLAYRDLGRLNCAEARRGFDWLLAAQDLGGGWGGSGRQIRRGQPHWPSSVEETSLALDALLADPRLCSNASLQHMVLKGLAWLSDAVERNQHHEPSPIGFYFAKLWYHEWLYPLIFATSALGNAVRQFGGSQAAKSRQLSQPYNLVSASID